VLGPDLLLVHCIRVNDEEIGHLARTRTPVSISILSNLRCGMGLPPVLAMMRGGVDVSLSLDTMAAADCADMFNAMRITMGIERAKADDGSVYQPRARRPRRPHSSRRHAGLGDAPVALRAGLKADVMLLRATDLNMAPPTSSTARSSPPPSRTTSTRCSRRVLRKRPASSSDSIDGRSSTV
jgi:5-methylthioadenosine/S-adenosylhomocysteine deaminase